MVNRFPPESDATVITSWQGIFVDRGYAVDCNSTDDADTTVEFDDRHDGGCPITKLDRLDDVVLLQSLELSFNLLSQCEEY